MQDNCIGSVCSVCWTSVFEHKGINIIQKFKWNLCFNLQPWCFKAFDSYQKQVEIHEFEKQSTLIEILKQGYLFLFQALSVYMNDREKNIKKYKTKMVSAQNHIL